MRRKMLAEWFDQVNPSTGLQGLRSSHYGNGNTHDVTMEEDGMSNTDKRDDVETILQKSPKRDAKARLPRSSKNADLSEKERGKRHRMRRVRQHQCRGV